MTSYNMRHSALNHLLPVVVLLSLYISCGKSTGKSADSILAIEVGKEDSIFHNLLALTQCSIPDSLQQDSLAFLVLPLHASCPACRSKTIDSIVKHAQDLPPTRFIILSTRGGIKTFKSYFQENEHQLPIIKNQLFLDSMNLADQYALYDKKPTIYYTYKRKAYKKIGALPRTVKHDLRDFFAIKN